MTSCGAQNLEGGNRFFWIVKSNGNQKNTHLLHGILHKQITNGNMSLMLNVGKEGEMASSKSSSQAAQSSLGTVLLLPSALSSRIDQRDPGENNVSIQLPVTGFLMIPFF